MAGFESVGEASADNGDAVLAEHGVGGPAGGAGGGAGGAAAARGWPSMALESRAEEEGVAWRWGRLLKQPAHAAARAERFTTPGCAHVVELFRADAGRYRSEADTILGC